MSIGGVGTGGPGDLLGALRDGRIQGDQARLKAATKLLEGQFYQNLFSAMRETVPEGGITSGGQGEEMFSSMMDQHLADAAASRSESGLGHALYRHFARHVEPDAPSPLEMPAQAAASSEEAGS